MLGIYADLYGSYSLFMKSGAAMLMGATVKYKGARTYTLSSLKGSNVDIAVNGMTVTIFSRIVSAYS